MNISKLMESQTLNFPKPIFCKVLERIKTGSISVYFPDGSQETFIGKQIGPRAHLEIINYRCLRRIVLGGDIGIAEGYMAGDWVSDNLAELLKLGVLNKHIFMGILSKPWIKFLLSRGFHAMHANTLRGSRRNISRHYDLGNKFYSLWLDESMTYSSAIFLNNKETISEAQLNKYIRIANQLDLQPDDRVLDIGCGWGGFAVFAAKEYGCQVVGITLSAEQAAFAKDLISRSGLSRRIDIRIQDYRDCRETFDKIVSSEMFEAVGVKNWHTYCNMLQKNIKMNGKICLQIITIDKTNLCYYRKNPDFIQRYIFHGGVLPSFEEVKNVLLSSNLNIIDSYYFGKSYAKTLNIWRRSFQDNWISIKNLGFDERFYRMWNYYLSYCEAGFECNNINVGQYTIKEKQK